MCGIAGEFMFDPRGRVDESVIVPMVSAIRHRGPDQWGYYLGCSGSVLLINTRLSIVDLSKGRQPLSNEDGSIGVVLNGELYGFQDMAVDLEEGATGFARAAIPRLSFTSTKSTAKILYPTCAANFPSPC